MNCFLKKVIGLTICFSTFFNIVYGQDQCNLPAPVLNIIEVTENSLTLEWEPVDGAILYQLDLLFSDGQEVVQQIQTEATSFTFDGLESNTFYDVIGQSTCSDMTLSSKRDTLRTKTRTGYIIVVDDIAIVDEIGCLAGVENYESDVQFHPIAPLGPFSALHLEVLITSEASPLGGENFEVVIFQNTIPFIPNNLLIGVVTSYANRVTTDQYNNIWMNEANDPNAWHFVAQINDTQFGPNNEVLIGPGQDMTVTYKNCIQVSFHVNNNPGGGNAQNLVMHNNPTQNTFSIYPNPVSDRLTIQVPTNGVVEVLDINGRVWHKTVTEHIVSEIPVAHWPAGTYILRYDGADAPIVERFIKL